MKLKSVSRTLICMSLCACMTTAFYGCGGNDEKIFPISNSFPEEFKETYSPSIEVVNTVEQSKTASEDTEKDPNSILHENTFDVYFDNTTGCFLGYLKTQKKNPNDLGYQMFKKTMTSFKDTFDCAGTENYKTYTLRPDEKNTLKWKEYPDNVLKDFVNESAYTSSNPSSDFALGEAPVTMWLEEVRNSDKNKTVVYISDLNENYGLLSETGTEIKEILSSDPEKDLLVISYVLPYVGEISAPTFENEGDSKSQVDTKTFDSTVYRTYYALAFGKHDTLKALCTKINEGFSSIDLEMNAHMYRDLFYSEDETITKDKSGNLIESDSYINDNPPIVNITDKDGNVISEKIAEKPSEEPQDNDDDLFADSKKEENSQQESGLENLMISEDFSKFFSDKPAEDSYLFVNTIPYRGDTGSEVSLKLENSDIYDFDSENTVIYTYVPENDGSSFRQESSETGWIKAGSNRDGIWEASINEDTISVKLSDTLSSATVPVVIVSVPVTFSYTKENISSDVINISREFRDWVESCKVPDIITSENEEQKYTKTYGFDSFIDKITGYKSMPEEGDKNSDSPDITTETENVRRINLILVSDTENQK